MTEPTPSWDDVVNEAWRRGDLTYQFKETQKQVATWWDSHDAVLTLIHARRGFGKTWFMLAKAFEAMAQKPNQRMLYAAMSREDAKKIVLPTASLIIPECLDASVRPVWSASDHAYFHPNGSLLIIEGADDDRGNHLRGPFADLAFCDEMAFWRMPDYVYRSIIFPMVERRNGRILGVSTSPESPHHEFATILIPEAKSEGAYVKITLDDDYTLSQTKRDSLAAQYSPKRDPAEGRKSTQFRREYLCELVTESERAVIPEFDIEQHVGETERPEYFDGYVVLDIGFVDYAFAVFLHYDFANATIVVENEVCETYKTVSDLAPLIQMVERETWGSQDPYKRCSDAQPIVLAEFLRQHVLQPNLVPREIRFSNVDNRDPEALLNRLRSMFASKRVTINPRCINLIKQCQGGLWNERRTDFERLPGLGHLDGVMALAYAVDAIDYQRNPEALKKKYAVDDFPVHWKHQKQQSSYEALARLMPKSVRRAPRRN